VRLAENVPAARLALDARRWYVGKIAPKRYGEKLETKTEISGPGGGPVQLQVSAAIDLLMGLDLSEGALAFLEEVQAKALVAAAGPAAGAVSDGTAVELDPAQEAGDY